MRYDVVNVKNGFFRSGTMVSGGGLPPERSAGDYSGAAFGNPFAALAGAEPCALATAVEVKPGMILFSKSYIDPEKEKQANQICERLGTRPNTSRVEIAPDGRPERRRV